MTDSSNIDKGRFSEKMNKKSCRYLWNVNTPTPNNKLTRELSFSHFWVTFEIWLKITQTMSEKHFSCTPWDCVYKTKRRSNVKSHHSLRSYSATSLVRQKSHRSTVRTQTTGVCVPSWVELDIFSTENRIRSQRSCKWTFSVYTTTPASSCRPTSRRRGGVTFCVYLRDMRRFGHRPPQHDNWSRFREIKMCGFWLRA